jgi:hypothetical protein
MYIVINRINKYKSEKHWIINDKETGNGIIGKDNKMWKDED